MKLNPSGSAFASPQRFPLSLARPAGPGSRLGQYFPRCQRIRQLSLRSLRAYAYDLLHFARWFQHPPRPLSQISQSTLLDYVRHPLDQQPPPTPQTVNHRYVSKASVIGEGTGCMQG
jgi:hypothetical protein